MNDFIALVQSLQMALKAMLMYTASHPRAQSALAALGEQVDRWLQEKPSLHIAASAGKAFLDGVPFEGQNIHLSNLAKQLSERQISGFILQRGVIADELAGLLELLILKPARIEEGGGAAAILAKKALPHIQLSLTQYKEVREGEGGKEDHGGPGSREAAEAVNKAAAAAMAALTAALQGAAGTDPGQGQADGFGADGLTATSPALDPQALADQWADQFELLPPLSLEDDGLTPANLGYLAGTPLSIGMGEGFPAANQIEGLRRALVALTPATLLSVLAGTDTLPQAPAGLRMAFQALTAETFGLAAAGLITGEAAWGDTQEAIFDLLRYAPQRQAMLAALEAEVRSRGLGVDAMDRFQEVLHQLDWESQSVEEKLRLTSHPDQLWGLSLGQRLEFLRALLDEGRTESLLALLDQILEALAADDAAQREKAAQTLTGIAHWMTDPGLPIQAEGPLFQGLIAHFGWEPLIHIHHATAEALDVALASLIARGEPGQALGLLRDLAGLCAFQDTRQEWRETALAALWGRLADPGSLRKVVELLHTANAETMLNELVPYLEAAGEPACRLLVDVLGEEPDRKRRGRLLEAIRGLGDLALPAVYQGLASPTWFLVRNTLNLLADMGDASALAAIESCLEHRDVRVKRAAVRALWKVGGPAAVPALLAALPQMDPDTQTEVMFGLGQVRSPHAVEVLAAFLLEHRNPARLRARAAETLGQIGDPEAIGALGEVAKRKGRIFTTTEPLEVRLGACRALRAIATSRSLEVLRATIAAEPENKERALLQQVLDERRPT